MGLVPLANFLYSPAGVAFLQHQTQAFRPLMARGRQGRHHFGDGDPEAACAGGWLQSLRCSASACLPLRLLGASSALPFSICVDPTGSWAAMRLVHQLPPGARITTTMSAELALRVRSQL